MDWLLFLFAWVVCASYAVQTITGFGSTLLCVTLGAQLLPLELVLTLVVPVSLLQTGYITLWHRRDVAWGVLLRRLLPLMGLGMLVGFWIAATAPDAGLKRAFGALVLLLAGRELWVRLAGRPASPPLGSGAAALFTLAAGVVHGIFVTGGPLLVYATSRLGMGKHVFRNTLSAVWLSLNSVLLVRFASEGRFDTATLWKLVWLLPAVPVGVALGEALHRRVNERRFELAVYTLLAISALVLLAR